MSAPDPEPTASPPARADPAAWADLLLRAYAPVSRARTTTTLVTRSAVPCVDVHNHLGRWLAEGAWMTSDVRALLDVMDRCNVATMVNLDGRWGRELEENIARYDAAYPGRFVTFCHVDWSLLTEPDGVDALVAGLVASHAAGARGVKVWKDLGLSWTDRQGRLVLPDDPRIARVFATAGALDLPVLIHTADPVAFFDPLGPSNERIEELVANPGWWFGDRARFPTFRQLTESLEALVAAHPGTTFVGAHVGCHAEDLGWVSRMLGEHPNFAVDLGGRLAEIGRQPRAFRRLVVDHPDQVLFGTDAFPVGVEDYTTYFRFLESDDEDFAYAPGCAVPPQGRWQIAGAALPVATLPALYADNARRLLHLT